MAELSIPVSDATVRVRMVDTSGVMVVHAKPFIDPVQEGHELMSLPVAAFLLDHPTSGRKVMFDLGIRKEYWKLPAALQKRLGFVIPSLRVDKDTTEILQEKGVKLDQISSVIWSHYHWDHTGSMELFPTSTELVVGPGFKESPVILPGFPHNPDSPIDAAAIKDRTLTEIPFHESKLEIGGFRAHDFFGDGSFYLLDTPGHCLGHMCGLARTTKGTDSTFLLLGGDICHFPGVFRPSPQQPLPDTIPDGVLDNDAYFPTPCPCSLFERCHPSTTPDGANLSSDFRTIPFYRISSDPSAAYMDPATSQVSANKLVAFDTSQSILICLAHDETMLRRLPTFNNEPQADLNDWQQQGYKKKIHWGWLNNLPRNGKPAREMAVHGFWRDKKPWPEAIHKLRKNGEKASKIGL